MATDRIGISAPNGKPDGPATVYQRIVSTVSNLFHKHSATTERTVIAYMVARAALLAIRAERGPGRAAQIAYRLADEFATER